MQANGWQTLLRQTFDHWLDDKAPRLGAALAFYSALSIGPLLLITISLAGAVFGEDAAKGRIVAQMQSLTGYEGAQAIQTIIANSRQPEAGLWAGLAGLATLLFSASGVFGELQDALNTIWNVKAAPGKSWMHFLKSRFLSFAMILGVGFLLLASLAITAALAAFNDRFIIMLPDLGPLLGIINMAVTLCVITMLFAMIYKILPDTQVAWGDVWLGSAITAVLFTIGKYAIGLYLGHSAVASTYGAAGSLVVLILWMYYSAQILYFGAELTREYAHSFGSRKDA